MDRPEGKEPLLLEPDSELEDAGIWTQEGVIDAGEQLRVVLSNPTGFTQYLEADTVVGIAGPVTFPSMEAPKEDEASVDRLTIEPKSAEWRKARVKEMFEDKIDVPDEQKKEFIEFLMESHQVFALEEGELGATDLLQFENDQVQDEDDRVQDEDDRVQDEDDRVQDEDDRVQDKDDRVQDVEQESSATDLRPGGKTQTRTRTRVITPPDYLRCVHARGEHV